MASRQGTKTHAEVARLRVTVKSGVEEPHVVELTADVVAVGSASDNQIRLRDRHVSRHHCVIRVDDDGLHCEDLGSTNGTSIAGRRVTGGRVAWGEPIGIGATVLTFEAVDNEPILAAGTCQELAPALSSNDRFGQVVGRSDAMRRVFVVLERVAPSDANILLEGETGTGKTMLAEAVHQMSRRAGGPFVVVDCGALPSNLLESELFGHERGAFTGAADARVGLIESAAGGTVLLDEIGELPLHLQPKLLRTLERRVVRRVGAVKEVPVDVRWIAATHRDLRGAVRDGAFRADLWYRLNTVRVVVPPLRDRRDDIAMLIETIYQEMVGDETATAPQQLHQEAARASWSGNVRELRSAVERTLAGLPAFEAEAEADLEVPFRDAKRRATSDWERTYLSALLPAHNNNVSKAARAAKMDRSHLSELARRYRLVVNDNE